MKRYTLFSALLFSGFVSFAQEASYINPNQNLVSLNPSFAGSNGLIRNQFSYRLETPKVSGSNRYYSNTLDFFLKSINGGVAVTGERTDVARGSINYRGLGLAYAQYLTFAGGSFKIVPSFQVVYRNSQYDPAMFSYPINWQSIPTNQNYFDYNTGVLFSANNRLFFGASVFHLTEPYILKGFEAKQTRKYTLHGSYYFGIGERSLLQTSVRFTNQSAINELNLGLQGIFCRHYIVGTGYTFGPDVAMGALGYRARWFSIVYNFDVSFSKLAGDYYGSHELHLTYNLRKKEIRSDLATFENF